MTEIERVKEIMHDLYVPTGGGVPYEAAAIIRANELQVEANEIALDNLEQLELLVKAVSKR